MLGSFFARLSRRQKTCKKTQNSEALFRKKAFNGIDGIAVCFKVEFALGNRIGFTPVDAWMPTNHSLPQLKPHLKAEFGR